MKKKLLIAGIVLIVSVVIAGAYFVFNNIFPKANPIDCPAVESIISVSVACNDDAVVLSDADFETLLLNISNASPTRRQSLNDSPAVRPYYIITMETPARVYHYFIYKENSQVYVEMPYEGIYRSDNEMFDFVLKLYAE